MLVKASARKIILLQIVKKVFLAWKTRQQSQSVLLVLFWASPESCVHTRAHAIWPFGFLRLPLTGAEPSQIFSSSFDGGQSPLGFFRLPLTGAERSAEAASLSPMPTENIFLTFCEKNIVLFDCCVPPRSISAPIHPLLSSTGCRLEPPACTELRGMRSSWSSESFFPASSRESASFFESLSQVLAFWIRPSTMLRLGVG